MFPTPGRDGHQTTSPPRKGTKRLDPNLTFTLQLHHKQRKIFFGTFGTEDFWGK